MPLRSRTAIRRAGLLTGWVLAVSLSCSSPNRGYWRGTFDGSVSGTVELEINARGTKIKGKMKGVTAEGQSFDASLEGILRQDYLRADFTGKAGSSFGLPVPFEGLMTGSLRAGQGSGRWDCQLWQGTTELQGSWTLDQTPP